MGFRGAAASVENLVRTIVREELRRHLGPEADHLLNVKSAPMSARKLRTLVRSGELRGYKHGKDTFVSASDFRAFIEAGPCNVRSPLAALLLDPLSRGAHERRVRCADRRPAAALARCSPHRPRRDALLFPQFKGDGEMRAWIERLVGSERCDDQGLS